MIDLMNNDSCPSCNELAVIHESLKSHAIYDGEPPLLTLSMLLSEVKMWRAKDDYDKKLKLVVSSGFLKQLKENENGIQMDSPISGLN
jgi:hypothetical protein